MNRPYEFTIICNKTGQIITETNIEPLLHHLQTWEPTSDPNVSVLKQTRTVWQDTRYKAKLRLFNYLHPQPSYNPFAGTDIGINTPILNF